MGSLTLLSAWMLAAIAADTVAVAVQPVDDRASFAIIEACNRALGETRCVLEGSPDASPQGAEPSRSSGELPSIERVRVALSSADLERAAIAFEAGGVLGPVRILEFDGADPLEERYRAIGLVIASRLLEEAAAARQQPIVKPRVAPKPPPKLKRFGLETALLLGPGLDTGDLRWGLRSRALYRPSESVPVSLLFAVRLAVSAAPRDEPNVTWTSLGLGMQGAVPLVSGALQLEMHAEGALQFVHVSLEDRVTGEKDSGSTKRTGVLGGAQLAWTPAPFWALVAGAESSLFWPPLILEVRRAEVAKEDPLRWSVHLGQRLAF